MYRTTHRVEPSFTSNLVATIRPELAVYDKHVRENLAPTIPRPYEPPERRVEKFVGVYSVLQAKTADLVKSAPFPELRTRFDKTHRAYSHLTDIKKLDLLLWQFRQGPSGLRQCPATRSLDTFLVARTSALACASTQKTVRPPLRSLRPLR